ncbi:Transposase [Porphyromonadaceae bacterium KH3CP3RA]|nr:Transposase [Porphyromonadaceae bacterium KH3CP3RA]
MAVLSEHSVLKRFRQDPSPESLHKFLTTHYPGSDYYSVYEAGFSGFWIHERLVCLGINNIVVNPADVPTMSKEKIHKTDSVDCGKLARELRSGTLEGIHVPGARTLEMRSLIRLRNRIVKDTTREKNRIKSFLRFHGIDIPEEFTRHSAGN